jgi:Sigma-70, region 4
VLGELNGLQIGTLDSEHSTDTDEEEPIYLTARPEDDPLFRYLDGETRDRLAKAIDDLPERERLVMTLYYYEETTMKEIGIILDVDKSRVSQIHASAVLHLRALLSAPATIEESLPAETLPKCVRKDRWQTPTPLRFTDEAPTEQSPSSSYAPPSTSVHSRNGRDLKY